jgi:hypothetical protein
MATEEDFNKLLGAWEIVKEADNPIDRIVAPSKVQALERMRELEAVRRMNVASHYTFEDFVRERKERQLYYRVCKAVGEFVRTKLRGGPKEPEDEGRDPEPEGWD